MGQQVAAAIARMDALLLGRKTYEIFAGYWPHQEDVVDSEIARKFNRISEIRRFTQQTEFRVGRLVAARIRCCDIDTRNRDRHENLHVIGSINFVQTLLSERLCDRLNLFLYPIVLGSGKKVFGSGTVPSNLTLAEPAWTSPTGAVLLHYELASGIPRTGNMTREMTRT